MRMKGLIPGFVAAAAISGVAATEASANYTTYWSTLHAGVCSSSDIASVPANTTKRRGAFLNGLGSSELIVNGGGWLWGAFTSTSGTTTSTTYNQTGAWSGSWPLYGANNLDPFIKNLNSLSVGGTGCFSY